MAALVTVKSTDNGNFRTRARWSANKKMDAVMRLLRGEPIDEVARDVGVEARRLAGWRDDFVAAGKEALKARVVSGKGSEQDRRRRDAERKVGELTMEVETLRAAARKRAVPIPPRRRTR